MLAVSLAGPAAAGEIIVSPGEALQGAITRAVPGDVLRLAPGTHHGPVVVDKPLVLDGGGEATILGSGEGSVVTVTAPGATLRGLTVRGSGRNLDGLDSGVFLARTAEGALVEQSRFEDNLFGVYIHGAVDALVRANTIVGYGEGRTSEAGNGVSLWNAPGARVLDNDISFGRDGILVMTSRNNIFRGNRFRDLRFAVHYMYANDSEVSDNVSTGNTVGFAIMFSHRLVVRGNVSDGDRDHGFLFNYANGSRITENVVRGREQPAARWLGAGMRAGDAKEHGLPVAEVAERTADGPTRTGPEKCVFIYNANRNHFAGNRFEGCEIGIHFTAGSEGNALTGNAFVANRTQVKYVGTRHLDWSKDGRGNYWSDNPAFDLDGDGIADTAYRPNDLVDRVLWTAPRAKVLLNSPAVQVIRWAQAQFPALYPGGVVDSRPLVALPPEPAQPLPTAGVRP
ncbi:nitrous oxide reductase family maturation protein NosD [Chelatococcus albus]|uniref:nitrous oxide reductase family maturation protein NosD n=1 Tax=Chelatococcus albus TaxID=3047466 RepID=UPI0030EDE01A